MKVLGKLYLLKLKGTIRNIFSKPSSAIFTIIMILLYGALIVMALSHPEIAMSVGNLQDVSMVILVDVYKRQGQYRHFKKGDEKNHDMRSYPRGSHHEKNL